MMRGANQASHAMFKTQTPQLCHRCGEYGRASIKIYLQTAEGPSFLCNSVLCVNCRTWVTMYTGIHTYPDFQCRETRLPRGITWNDVQKALMAKPACRIFTVSDFEKAKYGRLF
ncbi:MAG: hypothetical protein IKB61_02520 [Elusimicrobiaceae bacterium]|nr:hypothetical protein [Elusimicrobiaceae bacterium]MBR4355384.1 hypothetical protein [Elusimicrobiaceae bacterium]